MRGLCAFAIGSLVVGTSAHQNHGHHHAHAHKARQVASSEDVTLSATNDLAACAQECTTYWQYEWEGKTITVGEGSTMPTTSSAAPALVTVSVPVVPVQSSVNSPASATSVDACVATCNKAYDECRGAADSNKSTCAAAYASCLGYSPYGADGSLITPTICSSVVPSTSAIPIMASPSMSTEVASSSSSPIVETTSNSPVLSTLQPEVPQPTPIVSTIETPGIYTIPATTVTISKTTTVCGATTTSVPAVSQHYISHGVATNTIREMLHMAELSLLLPHPPTSCAHTHRRKPTQES